MPARQTDTDQSNRRPLAPIIASCLFSNHRTRRDERSRGHGTHRSEVRRHLDRLGRPHQECRTPPRKVAEGGSSAGRRGFRDERRNQPAARTRQGSAGEPRSARTRRRCLDRRTGHDRPAGDGADGPGPQGQELHRSAGARADRQCIHESADPRDRREEHPARPRARHDRRRRRVPGRRRARQPHDAGPRRLRYLGSRAGRRTEGGRVPDLHRCRRRLHDRPAHRSRGAAAREGHLRGNARDGQPRLQGAADPLGASSPASTGCRCGSYPASPNPTCRWPKKLHPAR